MLALALVRLLLRCNVLAQTAAGPVSAATASLMNPSRPSCIYCGVTARAALLTPRGTARPTASGLTAELRLRACASTGSSLDALWPRTWRRVQPRRILAFIA